ncbi:MAG: hypothetical protein IH933_12385 [Euryarchaeota archaeon]|nr:hypothetical protein [Euryarchaeota archaeon]
MSTIEEKRVFSGMTDGTTLYLASDLGVVRVSVSDDQIGEFGIEHQCSARDLAWVEELVVATDEDVLVGRAPSAFGPAVAVGGTEEPIAVSPEGRVARFEGSKWTEIGRVDGIRAADGDLLATDEGIYRVGNDLQHVGLDEANDISTRGIPLAATETGIYRLGNGWMHDLEGRFERVSATGSAGELARACALAGDGGLTVYNGEWRAHEPPERFAEVAVGGAIYGATEEGTLYVEAGDGWRSGALGVPGVCAMVAR